MKKQITIEIDNDNVIDIAFCMFIVASAKINSLAEARTATLALFLDQMTRKYLDVATGILADPNTNFEQSQKNCEELRKLVL